LNLDLKPRTRTVTVFDIFELPRQQRNVLLCLGRGYSNQEIDRALDVAPGVSKVYVTTLMRKSGMNRGRMALAGARMLEAMAS